MALIKNGGQKIIYNALKKKQRSTTALVVLSNPPKPPPLILSEAVLSISGKSPKAMSEATSEATSNASTCTVKQGNEKDKQEKRKRTKRKRTKRRTKKRTKIEPTVNHHKTRLKKQCKVCLHRIRKTLSGRCVVGVYEHVMLDLRQYILNKNIGCHKKY